MTMKKKGQATGADELIGRQLAKARAHCAMTQEKLGEQVGLTFQQIQKYELGANRISASRLVEFSMVFGYDVTWFTDPAKAWFEDKAVVSANSTSMTQTEEAEIIRAGTVITAVGDKAMREHILTLAKRHSILVSRHSG